MNDCTVLELHEKLAGGEINNLIDVREYVEFANGRIKNARNIPLSEIGHLHEELDVSENVYLICRSGRRSAEAQTMLDAIGFGNVFNVRGGVDAWQAAGFSLEKDEDPPWEIERQVRLAAGALVFFGVLFGLTIHWTFVLISAFVGGGLIFSALTNSCTMGMILMKMPWNRRKRVTSDE